MSLPARDELSRAGEGVLEAVAVDSFRFLVVTRVIACIIALPILTTLMNFAGMLGGFLAETTATGMPFDLHLKRAFSLVDLTDYVPATLKTMVFGFIIATTASYLGFNTESGTEGVGRASTRAVVLSSILIIVTTLALVIGLIFYFVPNAKVRFRDVWVGAVVTGLAWRAALAGFVAVSDRYDVIHAFTRSHAELAGLMDALEASILPDGTIWISWPKKAAKIKTDVTEDVVRAEALKLDLVDVKVCAIDDVWSGLKLVVRKALR